MELQPGQKSIGLKWVHKVRRDTNGKVIKYKARLVAKGYIQRQCIDFEKVFTPVTRLDKIRLLLALTVKIGWEVRHLACS